jgi:DNA (cytosine-5)-methyltransferase 1
LEKIGIFTWIFTKKPIYFDKECFNVQGYPKDYKYPNLSDARLYKAAGNSVFVPVVARIAHNLKNII